MISFKNSLFLLALLICGRTQAQVTALDSAETRREWNTPQVVPAFSAIIDIGKDSSFVWFEGRATLPNPYESRMELWQAQQTTGGAWRAGYHWYVLASQSWLWHPEVFQSASAAGVSHKGSLLGLSFYQALHYEHVHFFKTASGYVNPAIGKLSVAFAFVKPLTIKTKPARFSYTAKMSFAFDYDKDDFSIYQYRRVDRFAHRMECSWDLAKKWSVGASFTFDTEFGYSLAVFDAMQVVTVPAYKWNWISTQFGLFAVLNLNRFQQAIPLMHLN